MSSYPGDQRWADEQHAKKVNAKPVSRMFDGVLHIQAECDECGHFFSWPVDQVGYVRPGQYHCKGCTDRHKAKGDYLYLTPTYAPPEVEDAKLHVSKSGAKSSVKLPRYWLVPLLPLLNRLTPRFEVGADRYGQDNWRSGLADREWLLDRVAHAQKHLANVQDKMRRGVRTDETDDDLAAVAWFCTVMMEAESLSLSPEVEQQVRPGAIEPTRRHLVDPRNRIDPEDLGKYRG